LLLSYLSGKQQCRIIIDNKKKDLIALLNEGILAGTDPERIEVSGRYPE